MPDMVVIKQGGGRRKEKEERIGKTRKLKKNEALLNLVWQLCVHTFVLRVLFLFLFFLHIPKLGFENTGRITTT